jgi:two-component system chemotaxis response regulator CheY
VSEASDGLAALKAISSEKFDLIMVDLNMPVLDGMKLIKRVREAEAGASVGPSGAAAGGAERSGMVTRTRIAVITTESAQATEEQARSLGADFFLRKPVSRRDVDQLLAEALPG